MDAAVVEDVEVALLGKAVMEPVPRTSSGRTASTSVSKCRRARETSDIVSTPAIISTGSLQPAGSTEVEARKALPPVKAEEDN